MSSVTKSYSYGEAAPDGLYTGKRATTVQFYDEPNKKLGTQWEASRRIVGATSGGKYYSVIKLGNTWPIDLKSRVLGYTGNGVIGRMYIMPEGSNIINGLDPNVVHNMRATGGIKDFELYSLPTAPNLTLSQVWGADLILEGSLSNQARGHIATAMGSNRIMDILNREYVLEIESLSNQNISARLEMYNGDLDLPR